MRYSNTLLKTHKEAREYDSINATLLQKGGFIDQTMAGVYTFLPLGLRVLNKIEDIVRDEMNALGSELLMPVLSPPSLWQQTNRTEVDVLLEARGANEASTQKNDSVSFLNPTHEELITPIVQKIKMSYRDLPFAVYQIQTKFRNEERPKSGLMRGREFRMKDLYSFHPSEDSRREFYDDVRTAYMNVFTRMSLGDDTYISKASGGDFSDEYSEEFQVVCDHGEDTIYVHKETKEAFNKEVMDESQTDSYSAYQASEVGNIFDLGTFFPDSFGYRFTDEDGKQQPVYMGSYGIGTSRLMGVLVEKFHDDRGILWPSSVAPFQVFLGAFHMDDTQTREQAENVYTTLQEEGIEVLYDDRPHVSPGEKLADADILGIPYRAIVSKKTEGKIEFKRRSEEDATLFDTQELIALLREDAARLQRG